VQDASLIGFIMLSDNLMKLLTAHEGYEQFPYDDATGKRVHADIGNVTVGIGFNLENGGFSLAECKTILSMRLSLIVNQLTQDLPFFAQLDEIRQAALIDMAYNMGISGLLEFKATLEALSHQDYETAAKDIANSLWASEVGAERFNDITTMIRKGYWPSYVTQDAT
jgi:lysozyme